MKFARYFAHGEVAYGVVGDGMVKQLTTDPFEPFEVTDHIHPLSEVKLLAPCVPRKILAIGLNYSSHLHDRPGPDEPMVFYKTPTSLIGPEETIIRPRATERLDAEGELVVVIKDRCRNVSSEAAWFRRIRESLVAPSGKFLGPVEVDALQHVLGYTCGNDVSARDWQREDRNWWRAKSSDTFSPAKTTRPRCLHRDGPAASPPPQCSFVLPHQRR